MTPPAGTPLWAVILIAVVPSLATIDGLRDDMNGEFKTVNERVANAEREHLELREDIRELRRHR